MDQELRLEQKNQQLSTILKIVSEYVEHSRLGDIFTKIDDAFPEMDFYNCTAYKQSFPAQKKPRAARKPAAKSAAKAKKDKK